MKTVVMTVILMMTVATVFAAKPPLGFNGEAWNKLADFNVFDVPLAKIYLVIGIYEGCNMGLVTAGRTDEEGLCRLLPCMSYEQTVTALDKFYKDPRNLRITVDVALRLVQKEMAGESKEAIEKQLETIRKMYPEPAVKSGGDKKFEVQTKQEKLPEAKPDKKQ
ncbi:MAG: hypothetical protein NTZ78_10970 [Candidatus Aureabacteria bacterium]|nr:hypothetical protein [Candidatus Auribacterota bacterium]